ncbi:MAG: bifunctional folylpolyglutamate synthase/dihydrofolate synthase [Bacteroidetes bacterium]|nr:MAG: bifunctional folylpolyglutamate synthase/dihydrofolate synthase [Bacteroidota bacterium]TAG86504.1 MAG: bifunctional folylpolyglutamate synthase/dihydrofolate synthase [Bacteroidota bacterium]
MTYEQTTAYLFSKLPMFQRVGAAAYKNSLDNILLLSDFLGNPHQNLTCIHVAGTNGKGSTCHTLASILQEAGYKVGLFTSPHLKNFTERIRINGEEISQEFVINFTEKTKDFIENHQPSFFELTTAMAFEYFATQKTDINLIEVGMGGRLDSTNIITPILSVITTIGYDHQQFLGNTLPEIAGEKAGIIKPNIPVVISDNQPEIENVFIEKAKKENAPIFFGFLNENEEKFELFLKYFVLKGNYQRKNLKGILKAIQVLTENYKENYKISEENIIKGLQNVIKNTHLKGRWQILNENPLTICDTAHNQDGIKNTIEQLKTYVDKNNQTKIHFIMGFANDKSLEKILPLYPTNAHYYFCQFDSPRSLKCEILKTEAEKYFLYGNIYQNVNIAITQATTNATKNDLIFIGGSNFLIAEINNL